ncbi:3-hydroxyacyl-CoA dehydrogenase [Sphingomonas sp.]|jgi:3-hydroxyacyl-CoA dehydrogenase|uniref:3-hydroxyacyl-CoA dehydrogenase n=1 Tax=Sphingomonas sp. TaxID=28214 RepID=UPI00262A7421|nr:3-hydroxyacyl-CoA dehydrogenase [Sphingomonas sp.]MDF2496299.1 fadB [Sphingomonas sp.]
MTNDPANAAYVEEAISRANGIDDISPDTQPLPISKVGIVGAGTMGGGIAMNFANIGIPVVIVETKQEALSRGMKTVRANYQRSADRGRFPMEEVDARMNAITGTLDMTDLGDCDLIIEAVFESMDLKKSIFHQLDGIAKAGAILASNTSGLDVDQIASVTSRPDAVVGLHFFSPANVMKLVEVVRGAATSETALATAMKMARDIGKVAVIVGVCPGFVGNRMLYPRQVQANALLARGAMPWDVDRVLKDFGFKMGPFEMSDLAGLDIGWSKGAKTRDPLRDALCEADRRGQKTGAGFYDYDENRRPSSSPFVADLIRSTLNSPTDAPVPSDEEILESCLFPLVNEGAKILQEGKAQRPSDIDVVWVFGYGWPQHTGGPMRWADSVGLDRVVARAEALGAGNSWYKPADLLVRLAAEGRTFASL